MSSFIADIPVIQSTIQNILYEIFDYLYTKSKYHNLSYTFTPSYLKSFTNKS